MAPMAPYGTLQRNYVRNALRGRTPDGRRLPDLDRYTPEYRAWLERQKNKRTTRTVASGKDPKSP